MAVERKTARPLHARFTTVIAQQLLGVASALDSDFLPPECPQALKRNLQEAVDAGGN
jgi:hypothetical protein